MTNDSDGPQGFTSTSALGGLGMLTGNLDNQGSGSKTERATPNDSRRIGALDARSFWEKNQEFINKKEKKIKAIDEHFYNKHSYKPIINDRSKSRGRNVSVADLNVQRPWRKASKARSKSPAFFDKV